MSIYKKLFFFVAVMTTIQWVTSYTCNYRCKNLHLDEMRQCQRSRLNKMCTGEGGQQNIKGLNNYPKSPNCTCDNTTIYCHKNLKSVPYLSGPTNISYRVYMNNSPNLVIKNNSFSNITIHYLNLDNSTNIAIEGDALRLKHCTLEELSISNCSLNKVPETVNDLISLRKLNLTDNAIEDWANSRMWTRDFNLVKMNISNNINNWFKWLICNRPFLRWMLVEKNKKEIIVADANYCPVCPFCRCYKRYIYCDKNLPYLPPLTNVPCESNKSYALYLYNNPNLVVTDKSFENITLKYLTFDNGINISISNNALKHQITTLEELSLSNCSLKKVPETIKDLDKLKKLNLAKNQIQNWNISVKSVNFTELDISDNKLTNLTELLTYLPYLNKLKIKGNNISVIIDGSNSVISQLEYLNIDNTGLNKIPTGIPTLRKLTELHIGGSTLNDLSFYKNWLVSSGYERYTNTKSKVNTVFISNTNITRIPVGLRGNSLITSFDISGSKIKYVHENVLPVNLTSLTIGDSLLTRVNGAICSKNLMSLDLRKNYIEFIEKHDLHDCVKVKYLYLSDNKISYISPTAFDRLTLLASLELRGNRLKHIPVAIKTLQSIDFLYLNDNPLECSCEDDWFAEWLEHTRDAKKYFTLNGNCRNLGLELDCYNWPLCSPVILCNNLESMGIKLKDGASSLCYGSPKET